MRNTRLFILLLSFKQPVIASAQLVQRQPQGAWPDWNLGDLFWDGVTLFRGIGGMFQDPDSGSPKTNPPPDTDTKSDGQTSPDSPQAASASPSDSAISPSTEPVYKININNDPSPLPGLDSLPAILPSVGGECDLTNTNDADCDKATDQLIFTSSCADINPDRVISIEAKAQNQAIREALDLMNGQNILAGAGGRGLRISTSDICDVYFFAVPLTKNQIQEIEKKPGVRMVGPNQVLQVADDSPSSSDPEDNLPGDVPVLAAPGGPLKKRDQVVVDPFAWEDLRYISTRQNLRLSNTYLYYSKAGEKVTVFAADTGVNILNDEFVTLKGESSLLETRIYAMDTAESPDDEDNFGTCRTSKIVGRTVGVARKAKVMIVKVSPNLSSLIDVFVQIANYLNAKSRLGQDVKGYHVMSIMIQWDNKDRAETVAFNEILDLLINYFQLVIVVPAGWDNTEQNSDINMWPASAERRHNIIVVGAVNIRTGRTYPFSRGGPFLTVNAPGNVKCARNQAPGRFFMTRIGVDVATAQVAGLVAYLLSLDNVGPILRRDPAMISLRVKYYIRNVAAYTRSNGDFPSIWNLLGPWT